MSGVGKSFWAKRLAREAGFVVHDCDAAIGERLGSIVTAAPGEELVTALGRWMGMPWTAGYAEREARYLALEEDVTREALALTREGHVLDTTGSVIYTPTDLSQAIRARCRVVYLRTPDSRRAAMLQRYLDEPKPVVWSGAFPSGVADPRAVLPAAYADLLDRRDRAYGALAHVVLDGGALEADPPSTAEFLRRIAD
jgi:shikimate kinase